MANTNLTVLSQNLCCKKGQQDRIVDASFSLSGEFYAEKYLKVCLWNPWNVLTRMCRRKKEKTMLPIHPQVGTIKLLLIKKLDITSKSYGFSADSNRDN